MVSKTRPKRKHISFGGLSGNVTREYERKGYSKKRAQKIGRATAGKIARIKARRRK
jgi:hypothetical protein